MSRKFRTMVYVLLLGRSVSFINFLWFSPFLIVLKKFKEEVIFFTRYKLLENSLGLL